MERTGVGSVTKAMILMDPPLPRFARCPGQTSGRTSAKIGEAETGETLWVGWAQGDIGPAFMDPERMREWIDKAVELMFTAFPISVGGAS